jgi:hypothetical protein
MARKRPPAVVSEPDNEPKQSALDEELAELEEPGEPEVDEYIEPLPRQTAKPPTPPSGQMAEVSLRAKMPIENFARLAAASEPEPQRPAYYPTHGEPDALPEEVAEPDSRARYIEEARKENELRAHIYRIPDRIAPYAIPDRLPKSRVGWVHYGAIPFNPDTYESEIQAGFPPGNYWLDIRRSGQFVTKEIVSVAANPLLADKPAPATAQTPAPVAVPPVSFETPTPSADKLFKSHLDFAERLMRLQPQTTAPAPPTLREQLQELRELQKLFAPPQPPAQRNPLEDLVEIVKSEAFKQVKTMLRSPDAAPQTTWADIVKELVPYVAPALTPLLTVVSQAAARQVARAAAQQAAVPQQPATTAAPSQQIAPATEPPPAPAHATAHITPPQTETEEEGEEELNPIQQLVQDLADQRNPTESAAEIAAILDKNMIAKAQVKKLLSADNSAIWSALPLAGVPDEVLAGIPWRDEWLNQLRAELQKLNL